MGVSIARTAAGLANGILSKAESLKDSVTSIVESLTSLEYSVSINNIPDIDINKVDVDISSEIKQVTDNIKSIIDTVNEMLDGIEGDTSFPDKPAVSINVDTPSLSSIEIPTTPSLDIINLDIDVDTLIPDVDSPSVNIPTAPTKPSITFPDKPSLTDANIPEEPEITIPDTPDYNKPSVPNAPSLEDINYSEDDYNKEIEDLPNTIKELVVGGPEEDINRIEKSMIAQITADIEDNFRAEMDNLKEAFSRQNYILPSGFYASQIAKLREKYLKDIANAKLKALAEMSSMIIRNRQIGLQSGVEYERAFLTHHDTVQERKLKALIFETDKRMKQFEGSVKRIITLIESYKAELDNFNASIRAEELKSLKFDNEIKRVNAVLAVNNQTLDLFKAESNNLLIKAQVYDTEIKAYSNSIQAELLKIDKAKAELQVALSKIEAYRLIADILKIKSDINKDKISVYETQVRAIKNIIDADVAKIERYRTLVQSKIEEGRLKLEAWKAEIDSKIAKYQITSDTTKTIASLNSLMLSAYSAIVDATKVKLAGLYDTARLNLEGQLKNFEATLKALELNANVLIESNKTKIEGLRTSASVLSSLAASLNNAVNIGVSLNENLSSSESESRSSSENKTFIVNG